MINLLHLRTHCITSEQTSQLKWCFHHTFGDTALQHSLATFPILIIASELVKSNSHFSQPEPLRMAQLVTTERLPARHPFWTCYGHFLDVLLPLSEHGVIASGFHILLLSQEGMTALSFGRVVQIEGLCGQECGLCLPTDSHTLFSLDILKVGANKYSNLTILYETFILLPSSHEGTFYSKTGNPCPLLFSWWVSTEPFLIFQTPGMSRKIL